jgi:hypothetical protein
VLGALFALQVLAMLLLVVGAIAVPLADAHRSSRALAIGVLVTGIATLVVGLAASAAYAIRHVGRAGS